MPPNGVVLCDRAVLGIKPPGCGVNGIAPVLLLAEGCMVAGGAAS